jgi:pyrroloquinoline quinone biosynthesis protein B
VKVVVLGTAAGGGFRSGTARARGASGLGPGAGNVLPRTQDCLAVSTNGLDWYLVNESPDIRAQLLAQPLLAPGPGPRDTPIRGALLTDAELDHTAGLLMLREGSEFRVWAPGAAVRALAGLRTVIDCYRAWDWTSVPDEFEFGGLRCRVLGVHDKPPRYAEHGPGPWAVAYRIGDPATGGCAGVRAVSARMAGGVRRARCRCDACVAGRHVLRGGRADERDGERGRQRMGHVPISVTLPLLRPGIRWQYTHLSNTNPLLHTAASEWSAVRAAGADVLAEGAVFEL